MSDIRLYGQLGIYFMLLVLAAIFLREVVLLMLGLYAVAAVVGAYKAFGLRRIAIGIAIGIAAIVAVAWTSDAMDVPPSWVITPLAAGVIGWMVLDLLKVDNSGPRDRSEGPDRREDSVGHGGLVDGGGCDGGGGDGGG